MDTFDYSAYKVICFDEIYLYTPNNLKIIDKFIRNHNEIRFIATGDAQQMKSFGYSLNNISNLEEYTKNIINLIFHNQILLKINKR